MKKALRKSGVVIPDRLRWHQRFLVITLSYLARVLMASWRCRWENGKDRQIVPGPVIYCLWHNRLSTALAFDDDFLRAKWPAQGIAALISASRDGAFLATFVETFGVQVIRGSSSRRGPQALLEALSWLEKEHSVVITPDGPRGPCYTIQPGIIQLGRLSGRPIIPISNYIHRKMRFNSWDRFQIPLPFSRCDLRFGQPIYVPREASDEEREQMEAELKKAMLAITTD